MATCRLAGSETKRGADWRHVTLEVISRLSADGSDQSSGSTLTMEAPWLLPVQNVTGVVVLST